jgi:hypothetical protein
MRGVVLTQDAMRLLGQTLEGFGLAGSGALGFEAIGLDRCNRSTHAWPRSGEVQDDKEPDECNQDELIDKLV